MNTYENDVQYAMETVERIENELLAVLERYTMMQDEAGAPRYGRYLAMHAAADLLGRLMLSAIALEGDRARGVAHRTVQELQLLLASRPDATDQVH